MKRQLLILVIMMTTAILSAQVIHVPGDQPTIQAGIDASSHGDTILVAEGTYFENINFNGRAITVASNYLINTDTNIINNTIIDGSQPGPSDSASVVSFVSGEDTTSVLYGFSITGGSGGCYHSGWDCTYGGGIALNDGGARISHNKIFGNVLDTDAFGSAGAGIGGLMTDETPWVIIEHNAIYNNLSTSSNYSGFGGGIYMSTNCRIADNVIYNNSCLGTDGASASGAGFEIEEINNSSLEFIIRNNEVFHNSTDGNIVYGTGISLLGGRGIVYNNHVYENTANAVVRCLGGGIRTLSPTGKVTIDNNIVSDNTLTADKLQGGGIDIGVTDELVIVSNNHIFNNDLNATTASWGAAINFVQNEDLLITNNYIHHNTIAGGSWWCGAGIFNESTYGTMELHNNIIIDNTGTGTSYGGGICLYDTEGASYVISSNFIKGNHCNYGGGIWTFNTYDIDVTNNIFSSNKAWLWGGAYALRHATDDSPLNISIAHSLGEEIIYNSVSDTSLHPMVANNTFYNNTAGNSSGAIDSDQDEFTPIIFNNVFWKNSAPNANNIWYGGPDTLTISHCLINEADTSIDCNYTGHGNIFEDPNFEPGDSLCLIHGGPCHDAGTDELIVDGIVFSAPDVDFGGTPRPQGDTWDIGADECLMEFIRTNESDGSLMLAVHPNPSSGVVHLRYSISDPSTSLRTGARYSILELYTASGIKVKTLMEGMQQTGEQEVKFDMSDLPNGIYFIRLQVGNITETSKIIILK